MSKKISAAFRPSLVTFHNRFNPHPTLRVFLSLARERTEVRVGALLEMPPTILLLVTAASAAQLEHP
jgi:hypothetical protein